MMRKRDSARQPTRRWGLLWLLVPVAAVAGVLALFLRIPSTPKLPPTIADAAPGGVLMASDASTVDVARARSQMVDSRRAPSGARPASPAKKTVQSPEPVLETARVESGFATGGDQRQTDSAAAVDKHRPRKSKIDRSAKARREKTRRFGGTRRTEGAVEAGLKWIAEHQSPGGMWRRFDYMRQCPPREPCIGEPTARKRSDLDAGLTGLGLLTFLGAGYTHKEGPYRDTVELGLSALMRAQRQDGGFSDDQGMAGYNDSLATLALAECYAMTRDERIVQPLRLAVLRLTRGQQELGGWDYLATPASGRDDTSITAWMVQALQAAAASGITVPPQTLIGASLHFARASHANGRVWYSDAGTGFGLNTQTMRPIYRYGAAMTACALTCESLLGWRLNSTALNAQRGLLFTELPSAGLARGGDRLQLHGSYYWYYGTLAMFQAGGERWERWNASLRDAILPLQIRERTAKGEPKHAFGSWPAYGRDWGKWGRRGGRIYATAIGVLTLEIYYRHTPAYLEDKVIIADDDWRTYLSRAKPRHRLLAVRVLRDSQYEIGEPVLLDLLRDAEPNIAVAAAVALAAIDSPAGKALLSEIESTLPPWGRRHVTDALSRIKQLEELPPAGGQVRLADAQNRLATLQLPRAYVGMLVEILRGEKPIGRMRVIKRFSRRDIALARFEDGFVNNPPRTGDAARSR